jgi:hypothetical protein
MNLVIVFLIDITFHEVLSEERFYEGFLESANQFMLQLHIMFNLVLLRPFTILSSSTSLALAVSYFTSKEQKGNPVSK